MWIVEVKDMNHHVLVLWFVGWNSAVMFIRIFILYLLSSFKTKHKWRGKFCVTCSVIMLDITMCDYFSCISLLIKYEQHVCAHEFDNKLCQLWMFCLLSMITTICRRWAIICITYIIYLWRQLGCRRSPVFKTPTNKKITSETLHMRTSPQNLTTKQRLKQNTNNKRG